MIARSAFVPCAYKDVDLGTLPESSEDNIMETTSVHQLMEVEPETSKTSLGQLNEDNN